MGLSDAVKKICGFRHIKLCAEIGSLSYSKKRSCFGLTHLKHLLVYSQFSGEFHGPRPRLLRIHRNIIEQYLSWMIFGGDMRKNGTVAGWRTPEIGEGEEICKTE